MTGNQYSIIDNNELHKQIRVINKILTAQSMLYVFPTDKLLIDYAIQVVKSIPGVQACCCYMIDISELIGDQFLDTRDFNEYSNSGSWYFPPNISDMINSDKLSFIHLQTVNYTFGHIIISIADITEFNNYFAQISNFINIIAIHIENIKQRLELENFKKSLEEQIIIRTSELNYEIEQHKLTLIELEKSKLKFKTVADYTYDWEYWQGDDKQIIYMNPSCERISGFTIEEFSNEPDLLLSIVHPDDYNFIKNHFEKVHDNQNHYATEELDFRIINKNNEVKYLSHSCRAIFDENGEYIGRRVSNRDVSERKLAEEELRNALLYNRCLIEASLDAFLTISPDGIITDVNLAMVQLTGIPRYKLIDSDFATYFTEPGKAIKGYELVFKNEKLRDYPLIICNSNGNCINVSFNASLYKNIKGEVIGVFAIARDMSEIKKAQEQIVSQNLELKKINASKDKFFSIIAHDLRSPFSGFLGLTEILYESPNEFGIEELHEIGKNMRNSARNLYKLLDNLLEWSKMQSGCTSFNPEILNLYNVVDQNIEIQNGIAKLKNISLYNTIPYNLNVFADMAMVNLVLRNLITNAIKFSFRGGKIEIGAIYREDCVTGFVKDNGTGIEREIIDHLFRLDYKVSTLGTEDEPSTGLGLLLCKDFIEKHNCKIWVESEIDKGSVFYFTLPGVK